MKLKSKPTIRSEHRYVVFNVHSSVKIQYNDLKNAIMNALMKWMGEKNFSDAEIWLIKNLWNPKEQKGFIRCKPKYVNDVKVALMLIHQIGDEKVVFHSLWVSGTIKSGKEKTLNKP